MSIRRPVRTALTLLAALACVPRASVAQRVGATPAVRIVDDAGTTLRFPKPVTRIVSLIPSATETLIALGAAGQIVGRTRYDVAAEMAQVPSVGGGLDPSVEAIVALHPDVVITWEHDRRQRTRERLTALHIPVLSLRTEDTTDAFRAIGTLAALTGHLSVGTALASQIRADFGAVAASVAGQATPMVFYVVYNDPPMTTGPATFVGQLIGLAGGALAFPEKGALWPTVSMEALVQRQPDVIVLPVGEKGVITLERLRRTPGWRDLAAVRDGRVVTVPSNLLNRPGPHLGAAARALRDAIHTPAVQRAVLARARR